MGISLPGLLDYRQGRALLSPNVPITDGHTPARDLAARLGVDCILLQESHALCVAEKSHGQAAGLNDFALLDVGAGIGLGVMSGGRLLQGHRGLAGEIGHTTVVATNGRKCGCGNFGCLETVASDSALAWRVSKRLKRDVSVDDVVTLAKSDPHAYADDLAETAQYLAIGVATVVNLFNPSTVFIHSDVFEVENGFFERVVELTRLRALSPAFAECRIIRAKGNKRIGAIAGAIQHLTNAVVPGLEHV